MNILDLIAPTKIAKPGMYVREVFRICVEADVPGVPFENHEGRIVGKVSIRHILKETCIPDFMVRHSHLLGDNSESLIIPWDKIGEVLKLRVDEFVLPDIAIATPATSFSKALAIMENMDTTYLFVIDDGDYRGVVSITGIARAMLANV